LQWIVRPANTNERARAGRRSPLCKVFRKVGGCREALLLVERLKRRTRDPDVLALCDYVHGTIPIPAAG
jgi:hypothetical protein